MSRWNRQQKKRMRRHRERQGLVASQQPQVEQHTDGVVDSALKAVNGWLSGVRRALTGK
jgi:hypothetical protein